MIVLQQSAVNITGTLEYDVLGQYHKLSIITSFINNTK